MTGYERLVHDVSIRRPSRVANRRGLKSLSDIARAVSESADTQGRRSVAVAQGGPSRDVRHPDPVHSNRRIAAGDHRLTRDFGRSKFPDASASRDGSSYARSAVPRLGGRRQSFQSFAGHARRESCARADPATDRRGGTRRAVDRAQTRFGASHAGRLSSL